MNWEKINTAPKDGTHVLLWDGDFMQVAAWSSEENNWVVGEVWDGNRNDLPLVVYQPSHWAHVPEPPIDG